METEGARLGALLQTLRKQRRWTILHLARAAGVNKATISHIENGAEHTRPETLGKLAKALGTTADDLHQQLAAPGDPQRLRLLTLWQAILPEHRHVLLQEAERIAAASAEIERLTGSVAARVAQVGHLEALVQRLALQAQQMPDQERASERPRRKRRSGI